MCCVQVARRRYDNAMESESVLAGNYAVYGMSRQVQVCSFARDWYAWSGGVAVGVSQSPNSSPKKKECDRSK